MGIVDTWHATINFKIMVHALKKVLQKLIFSYKTEERSDIDEKVFMRDSFSCNDYLIVCGNRIGIGRG